MADQEKSKKSENTPDWLKTIQLNSWEAELLISALVLYALFQIPDLITQFSLQTFPNGSLFHAFFRGITESIELLKFGYTLHILVRGLWVASVGLSYVFPEGINKDRLKFTGKFEKELDSKKSLVNSVLRLEELSSIIYGITFLLFGAFLGFSLLLFLFVFVTVNITPLFAENGAWFGVYMIFFLVYSIMVILLLIDFLTNGLFRRIDWMATWFYPTAVVFRFLTLSFLYRRSLLVLVSNTRGWKSNLIPIIVVAICAGWFLIQREMRDSRQEQYIRTVQATNLTADNYENLRSEEDYLLATIQSDIVTDNALRVFMSDLNFFDTFYDEDDQNSNTKWELLNSDSASIFLNKWLLVNIDSVEFSDVQWLSTQHNSMLRFGFLAHLDLKELSRGAHNLTVRVDTAQVGPRGKRTLRQGAFKHRYLTNIHFFYDKQ